MSNLNIYAVVDKLTGINLLTKLKCAPTGLSLHHNKGNSHRSHHYNGDYNYAQETTDDDNKNASNCKYTSEKGVLMSVLAGKLLHQ